MTDPKTTPLAGGVPLSDQRTAEAILGALSPEAMKLAKNVMGLERENLHIKNPTMLVQKIVDATRELTK
ncbi:hypothetical protein [Streptomyces rugosispiralis]|uniref:Uncharacterized protein n=1 Tax=Streptomyces rugosispiralis TaxID=2967341 RepID=A0ABT1V9E7_9ACTN|nr:hypothetical protein [Streptomyces rugosispiralis]MCQ8193141.1 hypothetical protein [Streptomyces rugosispiralis]